MVGDLSAADPDAGDTFTFTPTIQAENSRWVGAYQLKVKAGANLDIDASARRRATTSSRHRHRYRPTGLGPQRKTLRSPGDARKAEAPTTWAFSEQQVSTAIGGTSAPRRRRSGTPTTPSGSPSTIQAANSSFRATNPGEGGGEPRHRRRPAADELQRRRHRRPNTAARASASRRR